MVEKVTIRLDLEGQPAEKFSDLKNKYGLKTNADVVRFLITSKWEEVEKNKLT